MVYITVQNANTQTTESAIRRVIISFVFLINIWFRKTLICLAWCNINAHFAIYVETGLEKIF